MTMAIPGEELVLDADIRNWVLLPIVGIMVLVTLLRTYLQKLVKGDTKLDVKTAQLKNILARSQRLRANHRFVSKSAFARRRTAYLEKTKDRRGILRKKGLPSAQQNLGMMGAGGGGMMEGMKNNMMFMFSNMFMIGWISYFFSGFVLVKVPFPLTMRFKDMLQRGIDISTLDSSYVSTLSWYFIVMFGLRGVLGLVMGNTNALMNETRMMQMQMGMGMGGGAAAMGFDAKKSFKQETESLRITDYTTKGGLQDAEDVLIRRYRATQS